MKKLHLELKKFMNSISDQEFLENEKVREKISDLNKYLNLKSKDKMDDNKLIRFIETKNLIS